MKLTTGILVLAMASGAAWAQNPDVIQNTRDTMKAVQQKKAIDSNAALAAGQGQPAAKPAPAAAAPSSAKPAAQKAATTTHPAKPAVKAVAAKAAPKTKAADKAKSNNKAKEKIAVASKAEEGAKKEAAQKINLTGRRDPFVSPVVNRSMTGSGCSTGKKCLAIGEIALKGVVKSDNGFIAVVTNAMNKAYFLRENDPVFNGYVVKITGDSVVFQENMQDRLGKPFTREVVKKITTSAV
jgi:membrane protein involved in colicin uptake